MLVVLFQVLCISILIFAMPTLSGARGLIQFPVDGV